MTQTQLGKGLGTNGADVSKAVVLGWEKDRHSPRADQLAVICERLAVNPDWLLMGAEQGLSVDAQRVAREFDSFDATDREHILSLWTVMLKVARRDIDPQDVRRFAGTVK